MDSKLYLWLYRRAEVRSTCTAYIPTFVVHDKGFTRQGAYTVSPSGAYTAPQCSARPQAAGFPHPRRLPTCYCLGLRSSILRRTSRPIRGKKIVLQTIKAMIRHVPSAVMKLTIPTARLSKATMRTIT
jgi:hypothetical protein